MDNTVKKWMIISWQRWEGEDGAYGKLIKEVEGTLEQAQEEARWYIPKLSPIGIVEMING